MRKEEYILVLLFLLNIFVTLIASQAAKYTDFEYIARHRGNFMRKKLYSISNEKTEYKFKKIEKKILLYEI